MNVDGIPDIDVRGLVGSDAQTLLSSTLSRQASAQLADRVVRQTGGNPLAIRELGGELAADPTADASGGEPLPIGERVEARFLQQVRILPQETQQLLLIAAAEGLGDLPTVLRAAAALGLSGDALAPAETAGLIVTTPQIGFRHPLMRSAIYHGAPSAERQRVHRALADAVNAETDTDRRAWHTSEAALPPDEAVAALLEESAERACARGGFVTQSAFIERAADFTAVPHDKAARLLRAARSAVVAGAARRAGTLLDRAQPLLVDARQSAEALRLRATVRYLRGRPEGAVEMMLDAARTLERCDIAEARDVLLEALHTSLMTNPYRGSVTVLDVARAIAQGPRPEDGGHHLTELILDGYAARLTGDESTAVPKLRAVAEALLAGEQPDYRLLWPWFGFVAALEVWDDDARFAILDRIVRRQREQGALHPLRVTLTALAPALVARGRLAEAEACYDEAAELAAAVGLAPWMVMEHLNGVLLAWQGRALEARGAADIVMAAARQGGFEVYEYNRAQVITPLELAAGHFAEALEAARSSYVDDDVEFGNWALPNVVEAAVRTGDQPVADAALQRLTDRARTAGGPWALGLLARSRAIMAEDDEAEASFREAIELLTRTSVKTDLARVHTCCTASGSAARSAASTHANSSGSHTTCSTRWARKVSPSAPGRRWSRRAPAPTDARLESGSTSRPRKLASRGSQRTGQPAGRSPPSSTSVPTLSTTTSARCSRSSASAPVGSWPLRWQPRPNRPFERSRSAMHIVAPLSNFP